MRSERLTPTQILQQGPMISGLSKLFVDWVGLLLLQRVNSEFYRTIMRLNEQLRCSVATMNKQNPIGQAAGWIIGFTAVLSLILSWSVMQQGLVMLYDENHMMEHLQLALILVAGVIFWRSNWCEMDEVSPQTRRQLRWLALTASALMFSFFVREMSVKQSDIEWLVYWVDGSGFKILMALIWLPLLVILSRNFSSYWMLLRQSFFSPFFLMAMAALALLIVGAVFDKEIFKPEFFRFYEEVAELNAYAWLLASALAFERDMALTRRDTERVQRLAPA